MFKKKLELAFMSIILLSAFFLGFNYYDSYTFKNNELSQDYKNRINLKVEEVLKNMQDHYGYIIDVKLIVTDKFQGRLYGLTSYENSEIKIYLNKKVMQESMDYMIESVIAHEYAHALMFAQGNIHVESDGHSKEWQRTCVKLGGKDCQRYVDQQEIIMSKMPF